MNYFFPPDSDANVLVTVQYLEFPSMDSARYHRDNYIRGCGHEEKYTESFNYGITVKSGPYLVGGEKKSNIHQVVETQYHTPAVEAYDATSQELSKLRLGEMMVLAEIAGVLSTDLYIGRHYTDEHVAVRDKKRESAEGPLHVLLLKRNEMTEKDKTSVLMNQDRIMPLPSLTGDTRDVMGVMQDKSHIAFMRNDKLILLGLKLI